MLDGVLALADRFGAIDAICDPLLIQPDKAATRLAYVLDELAKTFAALDDEMVRYLSLHFHSDESIAHGRGVLLGMEVGQSGIHIYEVRDHCHKIKNAYEAHLDKWFDQVFNVNSPQRDGLSALFEGLTTDDGIIDAMHEASAWLKKQAEGTLDAVNSDDLTGANMCIRQARLEAKPAREKLTETMSKLRDLQADFIYASGTV